MVLSKMANGAPDFHFPERKNEVHRTLTLFFFLMDSLKLYAQGSFRYSSKSKVRKILSMLGNGECTFFKKLDKLKTLFLKSETPREGKNLIEIYYLV